MKKTLAGLGIGLATTMAFTGTASAFHCTNANKPPAAGTQVVIDANTDEIVSTTTGLAKRFDRGLIGPDGEGYHGLVGLDFDGDGVPDAFTYIVTPNSVLPDSAMFNGSPDHGIISFD